MVLQDDCPNLFHLIRLRFSTITLQVDLLIDARSREDVMTSTGALGKSEREQQFAEVFETDIRVGRSSNHLLESLVAARHRPKRSTRQKVTR